MSRVSASFTVFVEDEQAPCCSVFSWNGPATSCPREAPCCSCGAEELRAFFLREVGFEAGLENDEDVAPHAALAAPRRSASAS
jgi:hypothetical protein